MPDVTVSTTVATALGTQTVDAFKLENNGTVIAFIHYSATTPTAATVTSQGIPVPVAGTFERDDAVNQIYMGYWWVASLVAAGDVRWE